MRNNYSPLRRLLTAKVRVGSQTRPRDICMDKLATGQDFPEFTANVAKIYVQGQ